MMACIPVAALKQTSPTSGFLLAERRPMEFTTLEVSGSDAVRLLEECRSMYSSAGQYPFLIGDGEDLERLQEQAEDAERAPAEVVRASLEIDIGAWIAARREERRD